MANSLLTISQITRMAIPLFVNSNAFIKNLDRQYDKEFGKNGEKIGSTLRIRLPNDYTTNSGPAISVQDTTEVQTVLTMADQENIAVSFTTADLLLSMDDFSERILLPMMNNLAGKVAVNIMNNNALAICNMNANLDANGGLLTPNDGTYLDAKASMAINSTPPSMQKIINDPRTEARVVTSLAGLLNPASAISDQYYEGIMYKALGATWYSDQTILKNTTGSATTATVNGANQTGPILTILALTGTALAGDIWSIAGVNASNMVTKQDTGEVRQFVITVSAANGDTSLNIFPSIIPEVNGQPVQYQTVVSSPADQAVMTPYLAASTTYRNNFRYSPHAITMATGDLPLPANKVTARHKYDNVSMRMARDWMVGTDQEITRVDVLFGSLTVRPQWGSRVPDRI
jgi:hypothetical protein